MVADGHVIIAVGNDGQFRKLVTLIDLADLADDPAYADNAARVANRAVLIALLEPPIARWRRDDLLAELGKLGVPAGPINRVDQVFADPQVVARGMRLDLPRGDGGTVPSVRTPILMSETPPAYGNASPRLGEHTEAILGELGLEAEAVAALVEKKVVRGISG